MKNETKCSEAAHLSNCAAICHKSLLLPGEHRSFLKRELPWDEKENEIEELKLKMDDAIKTQNFELAAQLRDKIKELEEGDNNE